MIVQPVYETRAQLSEVLERFRDEGVAAEPVFFGSHRKPEAVLESYEAYERREQALAAVSARASVAAEGVSPTPISEHLVQQWIEGEITADQLRDRIKAVYKSRD